jgi:hypothetical protein
MLGKVQRRHPYNLGKHSNSKFFFEIHDFANNNIPEKSRMLHIRWLKASLLNMPKLEASFTLVRSSFP